MKKATTYLFVCILSALVFYGGAGVNIITYCCSDCRTEGMEVLLDDACCDIHEHTHGEAAHRMGDVACKLVPSMSCDIERVEFEWTPAVVQGFALQPAVLDLFSFGLSDLSLIPTPIQTLLTSVTSTGPPVRCPRAYLLLLTTLLI